MDIVLRARQPRGLLLRGSKAQQTPAGALFETLVSVAFRHPYYNLLDGVCPDFSVQPTAATQRLMTSLGLAFRDYGTSFSVFYNINRTDALLSYLRRGGEQNGLRKIGFWQRMSFAFVCGNPWFPSITALPLAWSSAERCYFLSNQNANQTDDGVNLTREPQLATGASRTVISQQTSMAIDPRYKGIEVRSLSGRVVIWAPRVVVDSTTGRSVALKTIHLDFSTLPQDAYTIGYVRHDGSFEKTVDGIYTAGAPIAYAFADLLFSAPKEPPPESDYGIYPADLAGKQIDGIDYVLNFPGRATYWIYYVVQQTPDQPFVDLRIETGSDAIEFSKPITVTLPTGALAARFTSNVPLMLRQQSPYNFVLTGRHKHEPRRKRTIVPRLPVAGSHQVQATGDEFSEPVPPDSGYSLIYVYV